MLARARWFAAACASLALPLIASGCFGRGPTLGTVTGTVTLDGVALANAQVEFQPMRGAPSYGTTNSLGQYELMYTKERPGARVGSHVVRITTQTTAVDEATGEEYQVPQRVPEKYNYRSELIRHVGPGPNTFDFHLESEPEQVEEEPAEEKPEAEEPAEERPKADEPVPTKAEAKEPEAEAPEVRPAPAESPAAEQSAPQKSSEQPAKPQAG